MRLLTVPQPMGTVLSTPGLHGRPVLNRRFPASYRGRLVLVAGYVDRSSMADPMVRAMLGDTDPAELPTEAAIAVATLVDSHQASGACCAPWGTTSSSYFHLVLDEIRALREPVKLPMRPGMTALDAKEHAKVLTAL